jgi:transcriptional regulator with XRE-family HTH domain
VTGQASGHIGTRIKSVRTARDITQTQLAADLGVRERTIARWEAGSNEPDTRYLVALTEQLGCSLEWLMTGEPNAEGVAA